MGIGLPYTLRGCGSLSPGELQETRTFPTENIANSNFQFCYPGHNGPNQTYFVHGSCALLSGNETMTQSVYQHLYQQPAPFGGFALVPTIGTFFGTLCAIMAGVCLAGVVRSIANWRDQHILSITDVFG